MEGRRGLTWRPVWEAELIGLDVWGREGGRQGVEKTLEGTLGSLQAPFGCPVRLPAAGPSGQEGMEEKSPS